MVMVHGLMAAGLCLEPNLARSWARELAEPRGASWGLEQCSSRSSQLSGPSRNQSAWNANLFYKTPVWGLSGAPSPHRRPRRTGKSVDRE